MKPNPTRGKKRMKAWIAGWVIVGPDGRHKAIGIHMICTPGLLYKGERWALVQVREVTELAPKRGRGRGK